MKCSVSWCGWVTLLLASLMVSGCWPSPQGQSEEEKETHFLEGRSRVNAMDYQGAVESFERALESNSQSASAHFELGWLLDQKQPDPAAAIYHYEKYLKLRPGAHDAENVKERILACKQELARTVSLGPISEKQQRDLEKLAEENKRLTEQNKQLTEDLAKWRAYAEGRPPAQSNGAGAAPAVRTSGLEEPGAITSSNAPTAGHTGALATAARTHVVKPGETLTMIARKCGVKVEALMAANPRVEARRLRPGQTLNVP